MMIWWDKKGGGIKREEGDDLMGGLIGGANGCLATIMETKQIKTRSHRWRKSPLLCVASVELPK
ncbi:hypothetical protein BBW65_06030 [Helicobacter enhydrae]|uniref:Uncharacterized protein n=1 Tax=Helicobacter enhydrae TaxID=222136 RepID=A0A1B1U6L3_9HELI|nr:hypothetical protein BBW65_06030 [Helicobacter enhydrae]